MNEICDSPAAKMLADKCADAIVRLENIADEEDGCEHTPDGDGLTCSNCRLKRYVSVILPRAQRALDAAAAERDRQWADAIWPEDESAGEFMVNPDGVEVRGPEDAREAIRVVAAEAIERAAQITWPDGLMVWSEEERDGMARVFSEASKKHGHYETLFAVVAYILRRRRDAIRALAAPTSVSPAEERLARSLVPFLNAPKQAEQPDHEFEPHPDGTDVCDYSGPDAKRAWCGLPESAHRRAEEK